MRGTSHISRSSGFTTLTNLVMTWNFVWPTFHDHIWSYCSPWTCVYVTASIDQLTCTIVARGRFGCDASDVILQFIEVVTMLEWGCAIQLHQMQLVLLRNKLDHCPIFRSSFWKSFSTRKKMFYSRVFQFQVVKVPNRVPWSDVSVKSARDVIN